MATPILKPNSSWFTPTVSTITRSTITTINIVDSYTPSATPTDSWDASVSQDGGIMCYVEGTVLTIAGNGSGKIMANEDSSCVFSGMTNLTSVNCGVLDTSNATTMEYMFGHSAAMKLTSIIFGSDFNTSNVTNMLGMFRFCSSLTTLDITGFNTSSCITMERMFDRCQKLQALDCSGWDTSNVTSMYCMFQVCNALTTIGDVSGWNLSKCTTTRNLFNNCFVLNGVDVSDWDVSKVTDMQSMFGKCQKMTNLDVSKWDVSNVVNMAFTFNFCELVPVLDVSNWNVSKVASFNTMFQNCKTVTELDVSKWDTSSCTDMAFMLYGTEGLTSIDFSDWDVSKVTNFDHFLAHSTNLADYDVSKWNVTSACTNLYAAFHSTNVTSIDVTGWDVSNVIAFGQCFEAMSYLTEIKGLDTWDTSSGIDFPQMFSGCSSLKVLDLSSFDTTKANTNGTKVSSNGSVASCTIGMFNGMSSLEKIIVGEKFTMLGDGTAAAEGIGSFPTSSSGYWYSLDGTQYAPADIPNLTANTYYVSIDLVASAIWDRDSKKYMHLSAMRRYHDLLNASLDVKLDTLREEIGNIEDITTEEIQALFNVNV